MNVAHNDRNYEVTLSGDRVLEVRVVTDKRYIREGGELGAFITKRIDADSRIAMAVIAKAKAQTEVA